MLPVRLTVGERSFDWKALIAAKDKEIARLEGLYRKGLENAGAELIDTRAELVDAHTVRLVKTGATVTAERIVIATGQRQPACGPARHELCITSNEAFHLEELPRSILIAGAVTSRRIRQYLPWVGWRRVIYRGKEILSRFDEDMRRGLHKRWKRGHRIISLTSSRKSQGAGRWTEGAHDER